MANYIGVPFYLSDHNGGFNIIKLDKYSGTMYVNGFTHDGKYYYAIRLSKDRYLFSNATGYWNITNHATFEKVDGIGKEFIYNGVTYIIDECTGKIVKIGVPPEESEARAHKGEYYGILLCEGTVLFSGASHAVNIDMDMEILNDDIVHKPPMKQCVAQNTSEIMDLGLFSDIVIQCGTVEYKLHKVILAIHSTYFKSLFLRENVDTIELEQDPELFAKVVQYMYTNSIDLNVELPKLFAIYNIANYFDILNLINDITTIVKSKMFDQKQYKQVFDLIAQNNMVQLLDCVDTKTLKKFPQLIGYLDSMAPQHCHKLLLEIFDQQYMDEDDDE